ncbi:GNAT family N-acetyltransferase [Methylorubrum extorquens]|uniref:GNAT family N-acetyltransferase n=1 Tax=Methylorubrum extorquens TaxID=408 RepID=A0AAX3WBY8_METEX|nr:MULTISPECIES: GNAT family N-acetyltransferase [Methylobacteriaceae]WHQ68481.1 GNAT family N-acetyltransferase [Methylorubrum extorquens]
MTALSFTRNCSRMEDVHAHLTVCAHAFTPPLDRRVAIRDYAAKLTTRAERFEAWEGPALIGLVAVYCNDPARIAAFVTSVSVVPERTQAGIGHSLLAAAIAHARGLGFRRIALHVDREASARALYRRLGFADGAQDDATLHLSLDLAARRPGAGENATSHDRDREARP